MHSDSRRTSYRVVLGSLGTVAAGNSVQNLATVLEKSVHMLGQEQLLDIWDGKGVVAQDEPTPEMDAQHEDITLSNDDTFQVSLLRVVSGILGHGFKGVLPCGVQ